MATVATANTGVGYQDAFCPAPPLCPGVSIEGNATVKRRFEETVFYCCSFVCSFLIKRNFTKSYKAWFALIYMCESFLECGIAKRGLHRCTCTNAPTYTHIHHHHHHTPHTHTNTHTYTCAHTRTHTHTHTHSRKRACKQTGTHAREIVHIRLRVCSNTLADMFYALSGARADVHTNTQLWGHALTYIHLYIHDYGDMH